MQEGEVSKSFKTEFGWHILTVDKIKGQQVDIRHILPQMQMRQNFLTLEKAFRYSRKRVVDKEIDFATAAFNFSSEKETKITEEISQSSLEIHASSLQKMDPSYAVKLKVERR